MAYAWLARKQIEVFLGRIERSSQGLQPHLLGYVLVHEITQVIQGVDRHSADGVMKAHWDWRDLARIEGNALRFKKDDVELIFIGLERQYTRLPAAETRVELSMAGGSPQPANLQK